MSDGGDRETGAPDALSAVGEETDAALRSSVVTKHAVADALRDARTALAERPGAADELHDLMGRLAEDRFQLAVLGRFTRGKSSLINAVIGKEILPVGALDARSRAEGGGAQARGARSPRGPRAGVVLSSGEEGVR